MLLQVLLFAIVIPSELVLPEAVTLSSSVTTKGQVTIPVELREKLGIKPGDRVGFVDEGGRIVLQRQETAIEAVFGIAKARKGATLEQMADAVAAGRNRHARG